MSARPYILIPNPDGSWASGGPPAHLTKVLRAPGRHAICKASLRGEILQRGAPEPFSALSVVAAQPSRTMGTVMAETTTNHETIRKWAEKHGGNNGAPHPSGW